MAKGYLNAYQSVLEKRRPHPVPAPLSLFAPAAEAMRFPA
jgi:hypothetical protein